MEVSVRPLTKDVVEDDGQLMAIFAKEAQQDEQAKGRIGRCGTSILGPFRSPSAIIMSSGSVVIFKADGDTNHKLVAQYSPSDAAVMIILGPNHYCWVTENATVKTILDPDSSIDVSPIEAYRYSCIQALDGIRLIRIQPGNWDDDIRLTLLDTRLSESDIHYEALSYTWGNCKDRVLVFCGQERHGLLVTRNCEAALRRLRHTREVRTIWIDAICINQRDDGERNAQVRQMGRIYAGASRVLVYLGEHSGDSVVAMNCLKKRSDRYRLYDKDLSSGERKALRCLLARPWFNRVWVIQEVVMARTVEAICGSHLVPWSALENLVYDMDLEPADLRLKPPRILYISMQSTSRARTLWHLLCGSRYCASTDPKDKYFALLSITSSGGFPDVDYSKDVASLYTEIALYLLNNIGLDFLPAVQCCSKPNLDTPMDIASWVPDWSQQIDLGEIFYSNCPFDAGYSRRHFVEVIPSRSNGNEGRTQPQLKVRGTRIGRIEHVHSPGFPHCAHSQQPYIINLEESHDSPFSSVLVADRLQPYINALEAFHAPFHPISMTLRPGLYTNPLNKFHASFSSILTTDATKVLYKDGEGSLRPAYMESQEIYLGRKTKYIGVPRDDLERALQGSKMCFTDKLAGMTLADAEKGDYLCIFFGAPCPSIIRPVGDRWILISGSCYVPTLMSTPNRPLLQGEEDFILV